MTPDFVTINSVRYKILDRQPARYLYNETEQERKARGSGSVPYVEYVSARVERVRDETA